mmetsp:Transcript_17937/g.55714  ORF Transcript_17937/g.55714 Transcript_17937/m.55714 type:complete len:236 (-) Transcript_17937:1001-1708(-)
MQKRTGMDLPCTRLPPLTSAGFSPKESCEATRKGARSLRPADKKCARAVRRMRRERTERNWSRTDVWSSRWFVFPRARPPTRSRPSCHAIPRNVGKKPGNGLLPVNARRVRKKNTERERGRVNGKRFKLARHRRVAHARARRRRSARREQTGTLHRSGTRVPAANARSAKRVAPPLCAAAARWGRTPEPRRQGRFERPERLARWRGGAAAPVAGRPRPSRLRYRQPSVVPAIHPR